MSDFSNAVNLICKHAGYNEKAYADPNTGAEPYTFGYGTQFYPDGSSVKSEQCCSKEKAIEYLFYELNIIDDLLDKLNLGLPKSMQEALLSFIHSIGWESFLYSNIIDSLEEDNFYAAAEELGRWVFDEEHSVIGGLIERRNDEIQLFLKEVEAVLPPSTEILLAAFREYSAAENEVIAIRQLERKISPHILSVFANEFKVGSTQWLRYPLEDFDDIFNS